MWQQVFRKIRKTSLLLPVLLAGVCGCDSRATVTGKVSYQGRPVTYGSVTFLSADKTARSGVIEPDGSYTVEGVPPGTAKIAVISRDPSKGRSIVRAHKPGQPEQGTASSQPTVVNAWFPLPPRFEDAKASGLDCTVDSRHVSHDIDVK
jgi:hypothetical protein